MFEAAVLCRVLVGERVRGREWKGRQGGVLGDKGMGDVPVGLYCWSAIVVVCLFEKGLEVENEVVVVDEIALILSKKCLTNPFLYLLFSR